MRKLAAKKAMPWVIAACVVGALPGVAQTAFPPPPIPGPYPLTILAMPGTAADPGAMAPVPQPVAPAGQPAPTRTLPVPYWMQQPGGAPIAAQPGTPDPSYAPGASSAPSGTAPASQAAPAPVTGGAAWPYGRPQTPGFFPGYAAGNAPQPVPFGMPPGFGPDVGAQPGNAGQPNVGQPYAPFPAQPGWGWAAPPGYGPQGPGGWQ